MLARVPLSLQTLYADLAQNLAAGGAVLPATISRRRVGGRVFLYAEKREGAGKSQVYLGPEEDPAVMAQADAIRREALLARDRRRMVTLLKQSGLSAPSLPVGRVLETMSRTGLFERGLILVGTSAFQLYPAMLGIFMSGSVLTTQDADFVAANTSLDMALPFDASPQTQQTDLLAVLCRADPSFRGAPQIDPAAPPSRFIADSGLQVELLAPVRTRHDKNPVLLPGLNAGAIPLHFLEFLIEGAVLAVALYGSGIRVMVPSPERFAVHKLIVASLRGSAHATKQAKDLQQSSMLMEVLDQLDPEALSDAFVDARERGPKWRRAIGASLKILKQDR